MMTYRLNLRTFISILGVISVAFASLVAVLQILFKLPPFDIPTSGRMNQFTSKLGHFSLSYPEGWSILETPRGDRNDPTVVALIDYPKYPFPGVSVVIRRGKIFYETLAEVAGWGHQVAGVARGYSEFSIETVFINGEEALMREYTFQLPPSPLQSNPPRRCIDNYRLHNRIGYILTFCADDPDFARLKPSFQQMINSFAYLD